MRRSGKWYRKNEAEVMKLLGLEPTPNSGSGWVIKEDGQNEDIICQLKSTDAQSVKICKGDIDTLEHNALVSHKLPIFAIQFIGKQIYLLVKPELICEVVKYIETGTYESKEEIIEVKNEVHKPVKKLTSGGNERKKIMQENENKFKRKKRSAT